MSWRKRNGADSSTSITRGNNGSIIVDGNEIKVYDDTELRNTNGVSSRRLLVEKLRFSMNRTAETVTDATYSSQFTIKQTGADLELIFANGYSDNGDQSTGNTIEIGKVTVEYNGQIIGVTFGGNKSITIQERSVVKTDTIYLDVYKDTTLIVKVYIISATNYVPNHYTAKKSTGDVTQTTGHIGTGSYGFAPIGIVGTVATEDKRPTFLLIGDSNMQGYGDDFLASGFGQRIVTSGNYPFANIARGGESSTNLKGIYGTIRRSLFGYASHVITNYGTNDIGEDGLKFEQARDSMIQLWKDLKRRGVIYIYATTLVPRVSGTVDAQVPIATEVERIKYNDWLRTKPSIITDIIEAADVVETSRNSGIWKTEYYYDGIHPNQAGHTAIAQSVNTSIFI